MIYFPERLVSIIHKWFIWANFGEISLQDENQLNSDRYTKNILINLEDKIEK